MPIYEYRCDSCDAVFEEIHQSADDITEQPCPTCGKNARRIISNTTFVLKGGGWYVTEYGNKKTNPNSGASAEPAPSGAEAGSAKTEAGSSKSETTPPAASSAAGATTAMAS